MEKVKLGNSDVIEEIRGCLPVVTADKNGLKPASEVRMENRMETIVSRVIYESDITTSISTSLLISLAAFGGGPMALFYMAINRSNGVLVAPTIILNRIGGASAPITPRFKMWSNENTGAFKIILERTLHTPAIYVKILNTIQTGSDRIPLTEAVQSEVDVATYINVTP